jgi:hypothetical protein
MASKESPRSFTNMAHRQVGSILLEHDRLMKILESYKVVRLNKDHDFAEKLTWCLEHCQNKFRDIKESNCRAWYFQNEQDASLFAMRWADG